MAEDLVAPQAADAKAVKRRRQRAEYMRRWYQAKNGTLPLDAPRACIDCAVEFVRKCPNQVRCQDCQRATNLTYKRESSRAARRRKIPPLSCAICSNLFVRVSSRQRHCAACSPKAKLAATLAWQARATEAVTAIRKKAREKFYSVPRNRLSSSISSRINGAIRGKNWRKWQTLVGYTLDDLMRHLERQFIKGMTWDNYGDWHVDHILPVASFTFETAEDPDFRACWALTNLRPLWAAPNKSKGAKRLYLI